MNSDQGPIGDWVNLPDGVAKLSLWDTLHDGHLLAVNSDLLARTVTMRFDVDYVREFNQLPEHTPFVIEVTGVQSVRSLVYVPWPGEFSVPPGVDREEGSRLISEYHRKWRQESQSWSDFEQLVGGHLEVSDATIASGFGNVTLHLGVTVQNKSYVEAYVMGDGSAFYVGANQVTSEEFVSLGEAYWAAFARRS